jgi:hypothetical protein
MVVFCGVVLRLKVEVCGASDSPICVDAYPAAHSEVNYQRLAAIEIRKDIFRAAPQPLHALPD